jgi:hypothetical protein
MMFSHCGPHVFVIIVLKKRCPTIAHRQTVLNEKRMTLLMYYEQFSEITTTLTTHLGSSPPLPLTPPPAEYDRLTWATPCAQIHHAISLFARRLILCTEYIIPTHRPP